MSQTPETPSNSPANQVRPRTLGMVLFVICLALLGLTIWEFVRYKSDAVWLGLWTASLSLLALLAAGWEWLWDPNRMSAKDAQRTLVLAGGGLAGFVTVCFLGLGLTYQWWDTFAGGWESWQGSGGWRIWVCVLALVGGLAIMFVSLQAVRADEHASSAFRRVLYGYNAILNLCLLVLILIIVNVLVYIPWGPFEFFNTSYYWAHASILSLDEQSEQILKGLDKPLKVYAIVSKADRSYPEIQALLSNCRDVNKNIQVRYLSPNQDRVEVEKLLTDNKIGDARSGLLLVSGSGEGSESRFVKYSDMVKGRADRMGRQSELTYFNGEAALMTEIKSLIEGKDKSILYFTQGNGELDITSFQASRDRNEGTGLLKQKLEGNNYKVKGLRLAPLAGAQSTNPDVEVSTQVPDDCTVLVIVEPRQPFSDATLKAIKEYLEPVNPAKKKGKLIAFLDVDLGDDKRMVHTGLEKLLEDYNVQVGDNVLLAPTIQAPEIIRVEVNDDDSFRRRNSIAAVIGGAGLRLDRARSVRYQPGPSKAGGGNYQGDTLMRSMEELTIVETNLQTPPAQLIMEYSKNRRVPQEKIPDAPPSVAVVVSEMQPGAGMNPHGMPNMEEKPRMAIFGDATMISNRFMQGREGNPPGFQILLSTLAWLREKPQSVAIQEKARELYRYDPGVSMSRMVGVPTLLIVLGICGIGACVWLVRRR